MLNKHERAPVHGVLLDYDLMANHVRTAAGFTCIICGEKPTVFQWSDMPGEAMCCVCGHPYLLVHVDEGGRVRAIPPKDSMPAQWTVAHREYWLSYGLFACLGMVALRTPPGLGDFLLWVRESYPRLLEVGSVRQR